MEIRELTKPLQLSYIGQNFDLLVEEATHTRMPYAQFLMNAFAKELEQRQGNRVQRRIKDAKFPYKKYLVDLELTEYDNNFWCWRSPL